MVENIQKCPKCYENIQIEAKQCKHCWADLRNWFVKHPVLTIILFVFIVLPILSGIFSWIDENILENQNNSSHLNSYYQKEFKEAVIKVNAIELFAEYKANEIQADYKYKNKLLEVSGNINNIGKDILDNPYISLKTNDFIWSVQCMLIDSESQKASRLKKGDSISLEGENQWKLGNILLYNCKIK